MTTDRRTFLTSAGLTAVAVGTAAATAGCSATTSPGAPPAGNRAVDPGADSIPVGGGKILENASFVRPQPTAGEFKAFTKMCTHQGCPVSAIEGAEIVCHCHGARFSIADGSVLNGPATKLLKAAKAVVQGADVLVSGS